MQDVPMPKLSDSMERGTIIRWLVDEGQPVAEGDELVEIETDKAAVAYVAPADGVLHIVAPEGAVCEVGTTIARLSAEGEAAAAPAAEGSAAVGSAAVGSAEESAAAGTPAGGAATNGGPPAAPFAPDAPTGTVGVARPAAPSEPVAAVAHGAGPSGGDDRPATPLARRAAAVHGITLASITGTGPRGRITQGDVLRAAGVEPVRPPAPALAGTRTPVPAAPGGSLPATATAAPASGPVDSGKGEVSVRPLTSVQRVIATRMAEANTVVPAFQLHLDVVLDEVLAVRERSRDLPGARPVPSLNDFVVRAAALALRDHPLANGSYAEDGLRLHSRVNVGFAVAAEGTLLVPTVFDADQKSVGTIAAETRALAGRAREGALTPAELSGGTFTVSNLGMFGMTAITPVVNVPQAAILGVGAARPQLARVDGEIVERTVATLTLNCDHRILYGADAARFLADIARFVEAPLSLLL
ncbi:MAG TPA: dihydrolipoamide acetyltransferase family protein [Acidimicrobiales bacterium]|nr:dihydrolipoamide acetyltransferase family protein [Acidimicrobiales bacterium]